MDFNVEAYELAQKSVVLMKKAIVVLLTSSPNGMSNTEIGRRLGVNGDFLGNQSGWFAYTVLKIMEAEHTVVQVKSRGPWRMAVHASERVG